MTECMGSMQENVSEKLFAWGQGRSVCGLSPVASGEKMAEGGLRLQGRYKCSTSQKPLVTFLTVVWNNKDTLRRCMDSVWAQTYDNIEYIVVDGGSTDGTLDLIESYADRIDYYVSQKDAGIYDGMNKALSLASGRLINLINSDDWLEPGAAETAVKLYLQEGYDFLGGAGNVYAADGSKAFVWRPRRINYGTIFYGAPMLHQAVFVSQDGYEKVGNFDVSYRIIADFKQMIDTNMAGLTILRTNEILANFMQGGMSADQDTDLAERLRLERSYFPFLTEEDALILHKQLDVTTFWQKLAEAEDQAVLFDFMEKYKDQPTFQRCIAEAILMRYEELKGLYLQKSEQKFVAEAPTNWFKAIWQKGFGKK